MLIRRPHYMGDFQCLAGACPDTCCASWDIVIDEESLDFYQNLPGELGTRIRAAITADEDGDPCFSVEGGACPLLTGERLCAIQLAFGAERVCDVCRSHPRFLEEYGDFREESLAASCPGVARLLLADSSPAVFPEEESDEPSIVCEDVDTPLLAVLLRARTEAFGLLQDRSRPMGNRLALFLEFGWALQERLDVGALDGMAELSAHWRGESFPGGEVKARKTVMCRVLAMLRGLEILDGAWDLFLEKCAKQLYQDMDSAEYEALCHEFRAYLGGRAWEYEHLAVYFTYRWWLKADFDDDLYGKAALTVLGCLAVRELGMARWLAQDKRFTPMDQADLIHCWCKEQEHCAENIAALAQAAWSEPALSPERLMAAAMA